ncbi:MAG: hypothetical protein ACQR33_07120 [Candidatus Saccharibacteria bacterium]
MTVTHLLSKASGFPTLDNVFDLYVTGTSPAATGLLDDAGVDIATRYAPLVFGTAAAATGLLTKQSGNGDLNTLFAAKGTASYALPINGQTYTGYGHSGTTSSFGGIAFAASVSGYTVIKNGTNETTTTLASGSIPVGAVSCKIVDTWLNASGDTGVGNVSNNYASQTTLTGTALGVNVQVTATPSSPEHQSTHSEVITFYDASNAVISTTTITLVAQADGSA